MNKYQELWYQTEGSIENYKLKYSLKFYKFTLINGGINITKKLYKKMRFDVPYKMLGDFSLFPSELQNWIKNNILNKLNEEKIINLFIQHINNTLTENNIKSRELFMKSFKTLDIIKDIELDKDNILILTLKDDREFRFSTLLKSEEEIDKFSHNCHTICYDYFKIHEDSNAYVVTTLEKDLFNKSQYHSFIVNDDIVYDYSRNIIMNYEKYKILFKSEIIMFVKGKDMLNKIEELENNDNDFNELNDWCPVLKYALFIKLNKENVKNNAKMLKKI